MRLDQFALKSLKALTYKASEAFLRASGRYVYEAPLYERYVNYFDQTANDLIRRALLLGQPLMIAKFGTVELDALTNYQTASTNRVRLGEIYEYVLSERGGLWWNDGVRRLCTNAGFFPENERLLGRFYEEYLSAMSDIDILGSYIKAEKYFSEELSRAVRVNLDGYYAPFLFENPWTSALKGKRVLVVHPFSESIQLQYENRLKIWGDPSVLPAFDLITLKAVQSIAGEKSQFETWFDALDFMKRRMSEIDFDVALVGCGAYGLPLAAHAKRLGKQSVHLAGWLQVLFGIKGKRWVDNPRISSLMNEYWVSPLPSEIPSGFRKVEKAATGKCLFVGVACVFA